MGEVSESIYSDDNIVIPLADVQRIERQFNCCVKKCALLGALVVTKHTRWNVEADCWNNQIWLTAEQTPKFLKAWRYYRHELEKNGWSPPTKEDKTIESGGNNGNDVYPM